MSDDDTEVKNKNEIAASSGTQIPFPPFWNNMPDIWFAQMENIFKLKKIKSDDQKYLHVMACLPVTIIAHISDIIQNLPENDTENKYELLKSTVIKRKTLTDNQRLEKLLENTEIGDRSPSQFWRDLKSLAGKSLLTNDGLVKSLWIKRLPENIRPIVTSRMKDEIDDLVDLADSIWQITSPIPSISEIKANESTAALNILIKEVSELKTRFNYLETDKKQRNRRRSRSNSRTRQHGHQQNKPCYYHWKFGTQATKCKGGKCSFAASHNINSGN